jgi:hypothetical protein
MLSDAKFAIARNAVRHWGMVGHPRGERVSDDNADTMTAIRGAIASGKPYSGLVTDDIRAQAKHVGDEEVKHGADELERFRKGLEDAHVEALEKLVAKHDLGLPAFTAEWTDDDLVAWWAAISEPNEKLMAFGDEFRKWWDQAGNFLA